MKIKVEEEIDKQASYNLLPDVEARALKLWNTFESYRENRNQTVRFLNKDGNARNILDYVRDSVDRMNEFHAKPAYKEDWQSNTFDPITRNKIIFILGMMASTRMKVDLMLKPNSIFVTDDIKERKRIYTDLLDHANYHNKDDVRLIWEMYTCLSEGTVFGFEDFRKGEKEIEEIVEFDPDTGERTTRKIKFDAWDDVYGKIIPINEFYPETIWTSNFDDIHRCIWAREMSEDQLRDTFGNYPNFKDVHNASFYRDQDSFEWGISQDVEGKHYQVLYYFDDVKNKLQINVNMVELYEGPMPWNHGRIPFWCAQGEPIHNEFLYGKSFPDKLMSMQDINNGILNAMLDQLFMALNSPIFVDGTTNLDDGYLEPNRIIEIDPGSKVQKANLGNVDQNSINMLQLIKRSLEETSVSAQAQGVPTGGRKTKYEVQQLQEGTTQIAGLFLQLFEGGYAQKYWLRLQNKLQYVTLPSRKKTGKRQYAYIELDNRPLSNGKTGKRMIQIMAPGEQPPSQEETMKMAGISPNKDIRDVKVQPVFISTDYIRNRDIDLEIRIVPNSSVKESEFMRKQRAVQYFQMTEKNPLVDQKLNLEQLTESFDQPMELVKDEPDEMQQAAMQAQGGGQQQPSINPEDLMA